MRPALQHSTVSRRPWVGSAVTVSSEQMLFLRGVIVDVVFNRSSLEITHAIIAIDLGSDFPMLYQPIRLGLLRRVSESGHYVVQGSQDAINSERLPDLVEYGVNMACADTHAPLPQSSRIH